MKRYTIATGAGVLLSAASVFLFYGLSARRDLCVNQVPEPANVWFLKKAIREYRSSGAWDTTIVCDVQQAEQQLQDYMPASGEKPAIIFDIDDTALSNWEFILVTDFGYMHDKNKDWENSAKDTAIKPVLKLYKMAQEKGFAVFLITGRRENQRESTERNLRNVGFTNWDGVYFKPMDYTGEYTAVFKSKWRTEIQNMGYTLVLNIGDQYSDLEGDPQATYNVKIPNPAYFIP